MDKQTRQSISGLVVTLYLPKSQGLKSLVEQCSRFPSDETHPAATIHLQLHVNHAHLETTSRRIRRRRTQDSTSPVAEDWRA